MSEYQYYEFQAVDRALSPQEQAELRELSTRATITSTRFTNVYHYGSFKGSPDALMARYFDAFLYVANWGSRELQVRLPLQALPLERAEPYLHGEALEARTVDGHLILTFRAEDDALGEWAEGDGWLASLLPLRAELLAGDLRALYLGWLCAVQYAGADLADDAEEPPVPPGLDTLSPALHALTELFALNVDLLTAAAEASRQAAASLLPSDAALATWLSTLSGPEKDALLVRLMRGPEPLLGAELLRRFREHHPDASLPATPRRTVAWLRAAAEERRGMRERRDARRLAREQARALAQLATREAAVWEEVESLLSTRSPRNADRAVQLLVDLKRLAQHQGALEDFCRRLARVRAENTRRHALLRRLEAAGLGTG
jgi:hypothetical protein